MLQFSVYNCIILIAFWCKKKKKKKKKKGKEKKNIVRASLCVCFKDKKNIFCHLPALVTANIALSVAAGVELPTSTFRV